MQKLIVIVGPTASGKTALAVDLARKFGGEIVSADSRQVYKGMDVGTGKDLSEYYTLTRPSATLSQRERGWGGEGIPYHLIDIVSPRTTFTLAQYQRRAYRAIDDILRRGKVPILVGGTGLYVQAVVDGYVLPEAPPDPRLRARLAKLSLRALRAKLKKLDPATYRVIDKNNRRRLERAIEICLVSGVPLSAQRVKHAPPYDVLMLGLAVPKAELHRRIDKRLKERLKQGMIEEVKRLHKQGVSWKRLKSLGLEYRYVSNCLQGRYFIEKSNKQVAKTVDRPFLRPAGRIMEKAFLKKRDRENRETYGIMVRDLSAAIKDFARRQMTWFKRDKRIVWVKSKGEIAQLVRKFLEI